MDGQLTNKLDQQLKTKLVVAVCTSAALLAATAATAWLRRRHRRDNNGNAKAVDEQHISSVNASTTQTAPTPIIDMARTG